MYIVWFVLNFTNVIMLIVSCRILYKMFCITQYIPNEFPQVFQYFREDTYLLPIYFVRIFQFPPLFLLSTQLQMPNRPKQITNFSLIIISPFFNCYQYVYICQQFYSLYYFLPQESFFFSFLFATLRLILAWKPNRKHIGSLERQQRDVAVFIASRIINNNWIYVAIKSLEEKYWMNWRHVA